MTFKGWLCCVMMSVAAPTLAAADELECATKDGRISFSGTEGLRYSFQVRYLDEKTQKEIKFTAWLYVDTDAEKAAQLSDTFVARKTGETKPISDERRIMHVIKKDGGECKGRIVNDEAFEQVYRLGDRDGKALNFHSAFVGKKIPNMTNNGYIEATFTCHRKSFSTAGGCYPEKDDKVIWKNFPR